MWDQRKSKKEEWERKYCLQTERESSCVLKSVKSKIRASISFCNQREWREGEIGDDDDSGDSSCDGGDEDEEEG